MDINPSLRLPYRVGFLLLENFALMSYAAAIEPLRAANLLSGRELYDIRHIPVTGARIASSSGTEVKATAHIGEQIDFDLILVVAGGDPLAFKDQRVFQWLRHLSRRNIILGGVSGGSGILAMAGLMTGRRMTIHWEHATALAERFPDLMLERTLFVMDRDRLTCAGGIAPLDMMHSLIAKQHGAVFAQQVSDWFMHTQIRPPAGPQRAGLAERYDSKNASVLAAIDVMENHLADPLPLQMIALSVGLSARQLNRIFRQELAESTMTFYRRLRLDKARNLLTQSSLSITEISVATGFSSSAHFSHSFKAAYAQTPLSTQNAAHQKPKRSH